MASYDLPPVAPHKLLLAMSAPGTQETSRAVMDGMPLQSGQSGLSVYLCWQLVL